MVCRDLRESCVQNATFPFAGGTGLAASGLSRRLTFPILVVRLLTIHLPPAGRCDRSRARRRSLSASRRGWPAGDGAAGGTVYLKRQYCRPSVTGAPREGNLRMVSSSGGEGRKKVNPKTRSARRRVPASKSFLRLGDVWHIFCTSWADQVCGSDGLMASNQPSSSSGWIEVFPPEVLGRILRASKVENNECQNRNRYGGSSGIFHSAGRSALRGSGSSGPGGTAASYRK
jgi:hypothetical protein